MFNRKFLETLTALLTALFVLSLAVAGCTANNEDCSELCEKEYDDCMANASSVEAQVHCQGARMSCVGRCLNDQYYSRSLNGPEFPVDKTGTDNLEDRSAEDYDCPCQKSTDESRSPR